MQKITDINVTNNTILLNNNENAKCFIGPKYKNQFMEVFGDGNFSSSLDCTNYTK